MLVIKRKLSHKCTYNIIRLMVEFLIQSGADVHSVDGMYSSCCHSFASFGFLKLTILCFIMCLTENGMTPMHFSAQEGHTTVACLLFKRGARLHMKDNLVCIKSNSFLFFFFNYYIFVSSHFDFFTGTHCL
jgi:ankyrin repeat protein